MFPKKRKHLFKLRLQHHIRMLNYRNHAIATLSSQAENFPILIPRQKSEYKDQGEYVGTPLYYQSHLLSL